MSLNTPPAPWDPQQPEPRPFVNLLPEVELVSTPDRPTLVKLTDPSGRPLYLSPAHVIGVGSSDGTADGSTLMMAGGSGAMVAENVAAVIHALGIEIHDPHDEDRTLEVAE